MKELPISIKRLFWDVDKESVDIEQHRSYIISRIVDYGNSYDVRWMRKTYNDEEIKEVICKRKGISRKSGYFWMAYYKIPKEEVRCIQKSYPRELSLEGIEVADWRDIIAEKFKTIAQRGSKKDFYDLFEVFYSERLYSERPQIMIYKLR